MLSKQQCFSQLQITDTFDGKKEKSLKISCNKCSEEEKSLFKNYSCLICLFQQLYLYKRSKISYISTESYNAPLEHKKLTHIIEYIKIFKRIQRIIIKFEHLVVNNCAFKGFKCNIFETYSNLDKKLIKNIIDPVFLLKLTQKRKKEVDEDKKIDPICKNCRVKIKKLLERLLKILNNLTITKDFLRYSNFNDFNDNNLDFYKSLFLDELFVPKHSEERADLYNKENYTLNETYTIKNHEYFRISILEVINETEKLYLLDLNIDSESNEDYYKALINDTIKKIEFIKFNQIIPLEDLIELYSNESLKILNLKINLPDSVKKSISFLIAIRKLNLEKLFPLLLDDFIEEIFLDSFNDKIYINHQKFGRCRTNLILTSNEIERVKTLIRLYSGLRLDYSNPSIKYVIKNKYFYCRFAIDVEPVNLYNFAIDIRKLNKNILTIQDLLKNGTLNPLMASFLYFCVIKRINITVTGETDTGKTTFINALDMLTPKELRKIYIENIEESLNQFDFCKHQLKFRVDSVESTVKKKYSKNNQIKKLLHRTPDLIYLGEILTKREAEAMFHCLAAGLRGFQTIHADSFESLINRFLFHFDINSSCLEDLDIVILMKKTENKRKIISISEFFFNQKNINQFYHILFQYKPSINDWTTLKSLFETKVINKICLYENLDQEKFGSIMKVYQEIFNTLLNIEKIENTELVDLFHKLGYFSLKSLELLIKFWEKWKKGRNLNL